MLQGRPERVQQLAYLGLLAISRACFRDDPIGSFAAAFSNPGFFGIPLVIALLGQEATFFEAAYIGFLNVLQFTYGVALMTGSTDSVRPLAVLKAPFVAAIAVGLALFCLDLSLPPVLDRALGFLTGLNTPLAMFSVGVYLAQADLGQMLARPSLLKVSLVRLVAIPLALVLVLWAIPGSWHDMELAVLIACACPVGSNVAVYAQLHGKDYRYAAQTVVVSALLNAYKYLDRDLRTAKIVINGAGAAGQAIARLLFSYGIQTVVLCDTTGAVYEGRTENMNPYKDSLAKVSNRQKEKGSLAQVIKGKDIFIGVSAPGSLTPEMIKSMNPDPVIMAMANPVPEILPDEAKAAGARIVCTGRSDFPNQVNNLLAFPGIFRGALDVRAKEINDEMKIAAADAIASLISESELNETNIIASPLDPRVAPTVAAAVAKAALDTGVARRKDLTPEDVANHTRELLGHAVG